MTGGDPGITGPEPAPGTHHRFRNGTRAACRARPALHRPPPPGRLTGPPLPTGREERPRRVVRGSRRGTSTERRVTSGPSGHPASKMRDHARFSLLAILGRGHQGRGVSRFRTTDTGARDSEHRAVVVPGNNEALWNTIGIREAHGWSAQSKVIGAQDVRQSPKSLRSQGLSRRCSGKPCSFGAELCF